MTSYHIRLGYNAGHPDPDEAWELLLAVVADLRADPGRIAAEARRLGAPETCEKGCCCLDELADRYRHRDDLTCKVVDDATPDGRDREVVQYSSGSPALKRDVRRAFCRLVIEEAHRRGIEVCLAVS